MFEQYSVYWVDLNPTRGGEMNKIRPCVILSPTETNQHFLTVVIAPITTTDLGLPTRSRVNLVNASGFIAVDQIRALDKARFCQKIGDLSEGEIKTVKEIIKEYLIA